VTKIEEELKDWFKSYYLREWEGCAILNGKVVKIAPVLANPIIIGDEYGKEETEIEEAQEQEDEEDKNKQEIYTQQGEIFYRSHREDL
jgi:hypothetical protein